MPDGPTPRTTLRSGYARVLVGLLICLGSGLTAVAAVPAELVRTTWRWVHFASPTEDFSVSEPDRYTLTFDATGWVKLRADCNHGAGGVTFPGPGLIQINGLALTHTMCPHDTLSDRFSRDIARAVRWYLRDGKLYLELPAGSGSLWLARRP